jgi:subtilase family serine protease
VRAAYGLPALPAAGSVLNAAQAAQLGAGQTIYVVGARHNPNVAAELAAFNQKFGLPGCTTKAIAVTAALPLAAASASACELSVVYTTTTGSRTATAPAYESGWATELALDVQWAHATAPLARIVLIEAPDPSVNSLLGAIRLANAMGPGVVSMSFGR